MSLHVTAIQVASFFSGIGGIELGLHRAGADVRLMCEIEPQPRRVLERHYPGVPIHHDITEVTAHDLHAAGLDPSRTVLTAGFPCQDLSVAGRRGGMGEGTRSGLYWHVDRLLAEFAPAWVILENVPGLLSAGCPEPCPGGCVATHGGAMGAVLGSLADRGYGYAYRVLDAQYAGVPQRRRRVVIVGHLGDGAGPAQILFEPESRPRNPYTGTASGADATGTDACSSRGTVNTLTAKSGGPDDNDARAGHLIPFQKVIRSGARDDAGNLPPEVWESRDIAATLSPFDVGDTRAVELVVFHVTQSPIHGDVSPALGGTAAVGVNTEKGVRRLLPVEWERLQGYPDGWTEGLSDSARYRALGNSVAVPVFEWVARRLVALA